MHNLWYQEMNLMESKTEKNGEKKSHDQRDLPSFNINHVRRLVMANSYTAEVPFSKKLRTQLASGSAGPLQTSDPSMMEEEQKVKVAQ